ncbi:unnamed protein product, partial [Mesorhabditis spiculigera]
MKFLEELKPKLVELGLDQATYLKDLQKTHSYPKDGPWTGIRDDGIFNWEEYDYDAGHVRFGIINETPGRLTIHFSKRHPHMDTEYQVVSRIITDAVLVVPQRNSNLYEIPAGSTVKFCFEFPAEYFNHNQEQRPFIYLCLRGPADHELRYKFATLAIVLNK